jgi:hypothetical protein
MRKLETPPIRNLGRYPLIMTPELERDIEEFIIYQTGMQYDRARALIEKMRTVIGVQDLGEVFIQPDIDFSQPDPDPTIRAKPSPEKAFMDLMIYILENR